MMRDHIQANNEAARLADLESYAIMYSGADEAFNALVQLASAIAGTPISAIAVLDDTRQWFKARKGIEVEETTRASSFCQYTIGNQNGEPFIVCDTLADERFRNHSNNRATPIRFYAGFPLASEAGLNLGALCVADTQPRTLTPEQTEQLTLLQQQAQQLLELHKARITLEQQQVRMQQMLVSQRKLNSILAHETRGPLYSMKHTLDLLDDSTLSPQDCAYLRNLMGRQLDATCNMMDSLTQWGAVQLDMASHQKVVCHPYQTVQSIFDQYASSAHSKNLNLICDMDPQATLGVNPEALYFMLRNLIHNAIKFTEDGQIKVRGRHTPEGYTCTVSDTGMGMPAQKLKSLFSKKPVSTAGTRNEPGSGLGLMLTYDFVAQAGGTITVDSTIGKGTCFRLVLPLSPERKLYSRKLVANP